VYRLVLGDIYLFCTEVRLELLENVEAGWRPAYTLDVSEYAHLYQSSDPHFYDGIPEAAMLKRGMTEQERIDNGYWVAYQIALALEQRLAALR
jgi:hypothetical protein